MRFTGTKRQGNIPGEPAPEAGFNDTPHNTCNNTQNNKFNDKILTTRCHREN